MSIIKFLDSTSNKRKSLIFPASEDDIIINLPKDSGILATDRLAEKKIRENDSGYDRNVIFILKPDIKENNGGVTATNWDGYFKIASFRVADGYLGKHTGTEWVAYSDERLTTLVDKSSDDLNKEMWKPNTNIPNLKLYVRYRFVSNSIYSPWSDSIITTTSSGGISPFDVSVEENTLTPGCLISGFKTYGDAIGATHTATTWIVYESTNGKLGNKVLDSGKDSTNKTSFTIPNGVLKGDLEYSLQVTLHTDNSKYANSVPYIRKFTTASVYISRPILQYVITKDNQHKIVASDFEVSDSSERLVSAIWNLYDAETGTLVASKTNTNKEWDITGYISSHKKYYATLVYTSNTLSSVPGRINFKTLTSKTEEITATFDTTPIKTPLLQLSKYYAKGEVDVIKGFAFKSYGTKTIEVKKDWFNGKYNEPVSHGFTVEEFLELIDNNQIWNNTPIKIKGYIIGGKYNSDVFEATYTPNITLNYKIVTEGDDWNNLKFKVIKDSTIPTPDWVTLESATLTGDKVSNPQTSSTGVIQLPIAGYEYGKDYEFTINVKTNIGIQVLTQTVKLEKSIITNPTFTITEEHGFGNYVNIEVIGSEYAFSRPINETNGLKYIKLMVQDTSDNNKIVIDKIQTVETLGNNVYKFKLNYNKDNKAGSLKHGTKYIFSIMYVNKQGIQSDRVSKEYTTRDRDVYPMPELSLITDIVISSDTLNGEKYYFVLDANVFAKIKCDPYTTKWRDRYLNPWFENRKLDRIKYYMKDINGNLLYESELTADQWINYEGNNDATRIVRVSPGGGMDVAFHSVVIAARETGVKFVNPKFNLGELYEFGCIVYKEDMQTEISELVPAFVDDRYKDGVSSLLTANDVDHLQHRKEFIKKSVIKDPGLPNGSMVTDEQAAKFLVDYLESSSKDRITAKTLVFTAGSNITKFEVKTDFTDPSKCYAKLFKGLPAPQGMPIYKEKSDPIDLTAAVDITYDYNKFKPRFHVGKENGKWYLYARYGIMFPTDMAQQSMDIYPIQYINWGTSIPNDAENGRPSISTSVEYEYKNTDNTLRQFVSNINYYNMYNINSSVSNITIKTKTQQYTTAYLTTEGFINEEYELSDISSANFKIKNLRTDYKTTELDYPLPTLEYLPYDGCKLYFVGQMTYFLSNSIFKVKDEDNLICQTNPNIGINFRIYKVEDDGTETYIPGIEDAFSVDIKNNREQPETFGKWTRPVNKRPVLEPGKIYKIKIWFIPYNSLYYTRFWYVEKAFVAYKKEELPVEPDPDPYPNEYNRILQPVGETNYPLGDFLSFDIIPKVTSQDLTLSNRNTRIGREMLPISMTDMVNAEFQDLGTIPSDEVIACTPSIYVHTFKRTEAATQEAYKGNQAKIKSITVTRTLNSMSGIYRPESILGGVPADSFSQQKYFTTDKVREYGFYVLSPVTYEKSGAAIFTIEDITNKNNIKSGMLPDLYGDFYGYDVLSSNDAYKALWLTTTAFVCKPSTTSPDYDPSLSDVIDRYYAYERIEPYDGYMYLFFKDTVANVHRFLEVPEGTQKAHNLRTFRGVSIGETYTFTIAFEDGKVDTYTKVIRDFTKDAVEANKPILTNEHVAWDKIHNMPSTMPLNIKETFPYASNSEDKIYRALYIYKSSNFGKLNKYGTDCFSLMPAITRSIDTYNDNFMHINLFPAVYPRDVTVSAYYRSGPENSTWEATSPFKKPPVIDLKLFNNPDKDYLTGGGETDRAHRRSTFYNFAFNPFELERKTSTYYTEATSYDMIALVFNYAFYNVYNIIYYRVDRTTGEISYHPEDQDMVFKYEANPQAPLLSNKAMSYVHTVKEDGSIIYAPGTRPSLGDDNLDITLFGHIFLSEDDSLDNGHGPAEQMFHCKFNNDYSRENVESVVTGFVNFKDQIGTTSVDNNIREKWLKDVVVERAVNLIIKMGTGEDSKSGSDIYQNLGIPGETCKIDIFLNMGRNGFRESGTRGTLEIVYENCMTYCFNKVYSKSHQFELSNMNMQNFDGHTMDGGGSVGMNDSYAELFTTIDYYTGSSEQVDMTGPHLMLLVQTKPVGSEPSKTILRVFPLHFLTTTYSNTGVIKYCITLNKNTPGKTYKDDINEIDINYKHVNTVTELMKYLQYTPPLIEQFHGKFNNLIRRYPSSKTKFRNKNIGFGDFALTNSKIMYNHYYIPTGVLDPAKEDEVFPLWYTDLKIKSWKIPTAKLVVPVPFFPMVIGDSYAQLADDYGITEDVTKQRFLSENSWLYNNMIQEIRVSYESSNSIIIKRRQALTYGTLNGFALSNANFYNPNTPVSVFRYGVLYNSQNMEPTTMFQPAPPKIPTEVKRGMALNYPLVAPKSAGIFALFPKKSVSTFTHKEANSASEMNGPGFNGSVSHFWARPSDMGTSDTRPSDQVTFYTEDYVNMYIKPVSGAEQYYVMHIANPLKLAITNIHFIRPENIEINVYQGRLPLPNNSLPIIAVKVYKFNKFIDKDLTLASTSPADVATYHEKIQRIAYNITSPFMLRTDIRSKARVVPELYYRKGDINSPLMKLDRIPVTDSRLAPYKECDKYLREDTCGTPNLSKGVMGYYTFNSENVKFVSMDVDGNNPYFKAEPYDLLVVRYPMVYGIGENAAPYEQFAVYRVDPTNGAITTHPEDQGRVLPFLTRPYSFNRTETYGTVDTTKTVVAPRSNLGAEGMMMNHDTFGSLMPPVVMGPNGPKLPSSSGSIPIAPRDPNVPGYVYDNVRYVVDDEMKDENGATAKISYLFVKDVFEIGSVYYMGRNTPTTWTPIGNRETPENKYGHIYGSGYWIIYKIEGTPTVPSENFSPDMKLKITSYEGELKVYNVKLGNLLSTFQGGKEYSAIITV